MKALSSILFLISINSFSQSLSEQTFNKIKELSKDFPNGTELSIGIDENGQKNYYGILKQGDSLTLCSNSDKLFEIGSITKVFTCLLIANLVNTDKISLQDDIQKYYPFNLHYKGYPKQPISIEQLCNHTSGLRNVPTYNLIRNNPDNPYANYDSTQLYSYLRRKIYLIDTPGTKFNYSNLGYAILGDVIYKKTGKSFYSLLKETILDSLHMKNTVENIDTNHCSCKYAIGQNDLGKPTKYWDFKIFESAGALKSTTEDLITFLEYCFLNKTKSDKNVQLCKQLTFNITRGEGLGLGWYIFHNNSDTTYYKSGGTKGFNGSILFSTKKQKATVLLSNISGVGNQMENIEKLNFYLLNSN